MVQVVGKALWGQQFNRAMLPGSKSSLQVVRLQLDQSTDMTLYLLGKTTGNQVLPQTYSVAVAAGGTSLLNQFVTVPAVGRAMHWVTNQMQVDADFSPQGNALPANVMQQVKGAGAVALGRPTLHYIQGAFVPNATWNTLTQSWSFGQDPTGLTWGASVWTPIGAGIVFRVPPFAVRAKVSYRGTPAAGVRVQELFLYNTTAGLVSVATIADYADFQPLDATTGYIGIVNDGGPNDATNVQIMFEVMQ